MAETVKMDLEGFTQYDDFVEKFKPKKTTDDCYTPEPVYNAVRDWAVERYGLDGREIVRPFWPGGDYQNEDYPPGCVVIDNPPFSILATICRFYLHKGVDFFLFAPGLSLFKEDRELGYVVCDLAIRYENGAEVPTSFVTNMGENVLETAPELSRQIRELQKKDKAAPKYEYPPEIVTAARLRYIDGKGIRFALPRNAPREFIRKIDANPGKGIFGSAFLLGKNAAQAQAQAQAPSPSIPTELQGAAAGGGADETGGERGGDVWQVRRRGPGAGIRSACSAPFGGARIPPASSARGQALRRPCGGDSPTRRSRRPCSVGTAAPTTRTAAFTSWFTAATRSGIWRRPGEGEGRGTSHQSPVTRD